MTDIGKDAPSAVSLSPRADAKRETLLARMDAYPLSFLIFAGLMTGISVGTICYLALKHFG